MPIKLLPLSLRAKPMNVEDLLRIVGGVISLNLEPVDLVVGLGVRLLRLGRVGAGAVARDDADFLEQGDEAVFEVVVGGDDGVGEVGGDVEYCGGKM